MDRITMSLKRCGYIVGIVNHPPLCLAIAESPRWVTSRDDCYVLLPSRPARHSSEARCSFEGYRDNRMPPIFASLHSAAA